MSKRNRDRNEGPQRKRRKVVLPPGTDMNAEELAFFTLNQAGFLAFAIHIMGYMAEYQTDGNLKASVAIGQWIANAIVNGIAQDQFYDDQVDESTLSAEEMAKFQEKLATCVAWSVVEVVAAKFGVDANQVKRSFHDSQEQENKGIVQKGGFTWNLN
jgi:hypothetical protein